MLDWIEDYMEQFGCSWDTAAREYYLMTHPDDYEPDDYEY